MPLSFISESTSLILQLFFLNAELRLTPRKSRRSVMTSAGHSDQVIFEMVCTGVEKQQLWVLAIHKQQSCPLGRVLCIPQQVQPYKLRAISCVPQRSETNHRVPEGVSYTCKPRWVRAVSRCHYTPSAAVVPPWTGYISCHFIICHIQIVNVLSPCIPLRGSGNASKLVLYICSNLIVFLRMLSDVYHNVWREFRGLQCHASFKQLLDFFDVVS